VNPRRGVEKPERLTRSALLRRAGVAAATMGAAGMAAPYAFAGPHRFTGRWLAGELSIVQWAHFVPRYNAWFRTWAQAWGEQNDVEVTVDLEVYTLLPQLAAAEARTRRGHDIFGFLSPPARYEEHVIDHSAIVREVERASGPYGELGRKSTYNPKTKRFFGVSDYHVPAPLIWRHDVWNQIGRSPATWEHVREAAASLNASGHPIGLGMANDADSNVALLSLLMCFGAFLQDEAGVLTIDSQNTVEAVEFMAELQARSGESAVFDWNVTSNNQFVLSGRGSLIVNAISPIRRADDLGMPFARELWIWPVPHGPRGRLGPGQYTSVYSVWNFARNREAAERFVADLCLASSEATPAADFFNFPSFPGAHPDKEIYKAAAADQRAPMGKYSILTTVASRYTANAGYPGHTNAAVQETLDRFLIPQMFARVAQGRMTADDSVRATGAQMRPIWRKWRAMGRV
jgi:multiple sugar transport system substrate-binding protein